MGWGWGGDGGWGMGREIERRVWYNLVQLFFFLSNKIEPFINPLKSMINSAYSYSCKSKYVQLI